MNKLTGQITNIEGSDHFYLIEVDVQNVIFTAVITKMPFESLLIQKGKNVTLVFKETEVSLAKDLTGLISLKNRFFAEIRKIEIKKILSKVFLDYHGIPVVSIITASSAKRLDLKQGDMVECIIKSTAMSVMDEGED